MNIKEIELKNFRNYKDLVLKFNKNINLILGKNAQGKTNLLEAIYISSMAKSFRTNKDSEMIRFGENYGKVIISAEKEISDISVEIIINKDSKKSVKIDGLKIKKASELLDKIYIVIFSPEDLKIVKDEPEKRRKFINRELCQISPSYYESLSNYKKILLQRNAYLKEINIDSSILDIWDIQLAKYGAKIIYKRKKFIEKIDEISKDLHFRITDKKENLKLKYCPNIEIKETLKEQEEYFYEILKKSYDNDLRQRTTTHGPHKDDLEFFINEINIRSFGSQGQQRTAALSLKLAEINLIKEETGEDAVLLLDDVMSELDIERQKFLIKSLSDIQMFITTTEISESILEDLPDGNTYYVEKGNIKKI